jgi:hypothetical protein
MPLSSLRRAEVQASSLALDDLHRHLDELLLDELLARDRLGELHGARAL